MRCAAACLPRPKRLSPLGAGWTHGTRQKRPPPRHAWPPMLLLPPPPRIPSSGESLRGLPKRETGSGLRSIPPNEHEPRLFISTKDAHPFQHTGYTQLTATPDTSRAHRMRPHVSTPDRVRPRMPLSGHMYMHMYSSETAYTNQKYIPHASTRRGLRPPRPLAPLVHNSLRAGTCVAPVAPQSSVPPSDRRMPPSDPTKRLRTRSPPSTARPAGRHPCRSAQPTPRQSRSTRTHSTDPRPASLSTALRHGHSLAVRPQIPTQCMMLIPCARAHPPLANHPDPNERCRPPRVGTASPAPP